MAATRTELERQVESVLALRFPDVELVDLEVRGGRAPTLTLFIDRAGGVDLELCTAVTQALDDLRESHAVEVSSPGLNRRLRKPAHFAAAVGSDIAVRTAEPRDGRSNYSGRLLAADELEVTLMLEEGRSVQLPYQSIARAHVLFNFEANGGQRE